MNTFDLCPNQVCSFRVHRGILFIIVFGLLTYSLVDEVLRQEREKKIVPLVHRAAKHFEVDPYLALAITSVESNFKASVRGGKGEIGLMQLMPHNARRAAENLGWKNASESFLFRPHINVQLGCWYLSKLKKHPQQPPLKRLALLAAEYNAGWGNVRRWRRRAKRKNIPFTEAITYPSTRFYVKKVRAEYLRYKSENIFSK